MNSVTEAFRLMCEEHGARIAVTTGAESITYRQLDELSDRIAGGMAREGVRAGALVPLMMGRSSLFIGAALGALKLGAAYVPIDPTYPAERRRVMLEQLGNACGPVRVAESDEDEWISATRLANSDRADAIKVSAEAAAYVMFTSGSTGTPKGVLVPHRGIVRLVRGANFADFGPEHRWAVLSSLAFDASTIEIWGALLNGGECVVVQDQLPTLDRIAGLFSERRVTDVWFTAGLFNAVMDFRPDIFSSMRQVFTGGESESFPHFRKFVNMFPGVRLVHGYGPTENTTFSLCHTVRRADVTEDGRVPIGTAISGTVVRIVGSDGLDASDGAGELYVGGEGLALGYVGQPELTDEKFVRLAGSEGVWYRTGDRVQRREDGLIEFRGRVDRQVKVRGFRIEPEEIEGVLACCDGVMGAVVDVVGDTPETKRLVAHCAVGRAATNLTESTRIRIWLTARLPSYMIPATFFLVESLPLNASGKVDRSQLRAMAAAKGATTRTLSGQHPQSRKTLD